MESAFLPSDRWGRNLTSYTSDTKKREYATNAVSLGALGCITIVALAIAYSWLFPNVGAPLAASAMRMAEEMQGLREQNALLRAHLQRVAQAQQLMLQNTEKDKGNTNQSHVETHSTVRRLLSETVDLLGELAQPDVTNGVLDGVLNVAPSVAPAIVAPSTNIAGREAPSRLYQASQSAARSQSDASHSPSASLNADTDTPSVFEKLAPLVPQGLIAFTEVAGGMGQGIRKFSYNLYVHFFASNEGSHSHHRNHNIGARRTSATGTGWRQKYRKEAQKNTKRLKVMRSARSQRKGNFARNKRFRRL